MSVQSPVVLRNPKKVSDDGFGALVFEPFCVELVEVVAFLFSPTHVSSFK